MMSIKGRPRGKGIVTKKLEEWFRQADYDLDTAEFMFAGGRYFYAIFMCHLSIKKALKGLYVQFREATAPRSHNLVYLAEKTGLQLPEELNDFISLLDGVSVPTRYPDDLQRLLKDYDKARTKEMLEKSREVLRWLRAKSQK